MKQIIASLLLLAASLQGQEVTVGTAPVPTVLNAPVAPVLHDGTPVKLKLGRTLSSATAQVDDSVDFEVLEEVKVGDTVVVPRGGTAIGTITQAQPKRRMGRGGKLDLNIDYVRMVNGEKAALRAVAARQGGGHTGAMVGGMVAVGLIVWPVAPLFLLMHGKDITIPKGTQITAYIDGEIPLGVAKKEGK